MHLQRSLLVLALSFLPLAAHPHNLIDAVSDPRLLPAVVMETSVDGFQTIAIDGFIHTQTVTAFHQALEKNDSPYGMIYLNSEGGDISAAMTLGRAIREAGYAVRIGKIGKDGNQIRAGVCFSACPIAFFGGQYRLFDTSTGQMGVHSLSRAVPGRWAEDSKLIHNAVHELGIYLDEMGINRELLDLIRNTPANDMSAITMQHATYWNITSKPEVTVWEYSAGRLEGKTSSATGEGAFEFWCEDGEIQYKAGLRPWFPAAALLNYDKHSFTINGNPLPIDAVRVSYDDKVKRLEMHTTLSPNMIASLSRASRIGYSLNYEDKRGGYQRSIALGQHKANLDHLVAQCAGSQPDMDNGKME